jgi:L-lactate dehydrogenase complex protein LldG
MSEAREVILARVRRALPEQRPAVDIPREYRRTSGDLGRTGLVARFAERVAEYRACVRVVEGAQVAATVGDILAAHDAQRMLLPEGVPAEWLPLGVEGLGDPGGAAALDAADGVLTTCALAVAETGTIALDGGSGQGRRALTLVPDLHVCVVREHQIVGLVPEAVARLAAVVRARRAPITLIAGPSATSDIELSRVEGVHGPRRLEVVVACS